MSYAIEQFGEGMYKITLKTSNDIFTTIYSDEDDLRSNFENDVRRFNSYNNRQ